MYLAGAALTVIKAYSRYKAVWGGGTAAGRALGAEARDRLGAAEGAARRGRERLRGACVADLQRARASVADFRRRIARPVAGPEYIEALANSMDAGEGAIAEARARLRRGLAELAREEEALARELAPAVAALDAPELRSRARGDAPPAESRPPQRRGPGKPGAPRPPLETHPLPEAPEGRVAQVKRFEAFEQRHGGRLGGWGEGEQAAFLRAWRVGRGDPARVVPLATRDLLGARSAEEVAAHAEWWAEREALYAAQKAAVARWRRDREEEAARARAESAADVVDPAAAQALARSEKAAARRQAAARKNRTALEEWKNQKEEQARAEAEARAEALSRRKAERQAALRARKRQAEVLRAEEERRRSLQEAAGPPAKPPPTEAELERQQKKRAALAALWSRDRERVERKRSVKGKREKDLERRKQRQEQIAREVSLKFEARVARDVARLEKPTAALAERQRQEKEQRGLFEQASGFVSRMPSRIKPAWREGI